MKDTWMKKSLVVSVILLFLGVTVAPSINFNVVKASNDNDLVEVTTQACGINGFGDTTVKLTREQYQDLEQYLVDFRERLNQTTTREEAVPIFNEAVVELNKYGMLPKGLSVERAQKLVIGGYQNERVTKFIEKFYNKYPKNSDGKNVFCLVAGMTSYTFFIGFPLFFPIKLFSIVTFGVWYNLWGPQYQYAAGWVYSIGLFGFKHWNGAAFFGKIANIGHDLILSVGAIGFTGLRLGIPPLINFYIGSVVFLYIE
jgi:hypothetical protein